MENLPLAQGISHADGATSKGVARCSIRAAQMGRFQPGPLRPGERVVPHITPQLQPWRRLQYLRLRLRCPPAHVDGRQANRNRRKLRTENITQTQTFFTDPERMMLYKTHILSFFETYIAAIYHAAPSMLA